MINKELIRFLADIQKEEKSPYIYIYILCFSDMFAIKRQLKFHSSWRERGKAAPAATWKEPRGQLIDAAEAACPASADMLDKLANNYRSLLPAGPNPTNISMRNWTQSLQKIVPLQPEATALTSQSYSPAAAKTIHYAGLKLNANE